MIEAFIELGIIVFLAVIISAIMRALKQPLLIGYILTGILVSPYFLNLAKGDFISIFAQIGVALLLFLVGLNLDPKVLKEVGKVSLFTGIGQIIFTTGIGLLVCLLLGFPLIVSLYVSIALAFSSTIIIMKLLSDKNALETLYGKISVGFLVVQDIVAIFILIVISSLKDGFSLSVLGNIGIGIFLIIFLLLISVYVLPRFVKFVAKSQEFLLLFAISWCIALASLFYVFGFSIEIGALLAGFFLSFLPYRQEINFKLRPLRDFFLISFFVQLGLNMTFGNISQFIFPIIILSLFILIGNPIIVMIIMGKMGYTKKTGFMAGLTVAQISEFSLILISLGVSVGHLSPEILSVVTIIGLITIIGSSYMIIYSEKIYSKISKLLSVFERKDKKINEVTYKNKAYDYIIFGYNRLGYNLVESFIKHKKNILVIDYNPEKINLLEKNKIDYIYGDVSNLELLCELDLTKTKTIISTINDIDSDLLLIKKIKEKNHKIKLIFVADNTDNALKLYTFGADYVIMPRYLSSYYVSNLLNIDEHNSEKIAKERFNHITDLKNKKLKEGIGKDLENLK